MDDHLHSDETFGVIAQNFDASASTKRVIGVDYEKYQRLLDESGLPEDAKREIIDALWSIIVSFVDLGFGVHPMQEVCGKDAQNGADRALEPSKALYLGSETPHNVIGSPPGRDST